MVPEIVHDLCARFERNREQYRSTSYNEAQLRQEFLNPLFNKALGWDMENEQGFAEAYKDVVHEDSIRVEGSVKAPDYCFRIGGTKKFFLEAKKPSVFVKDDAGPAYQLRRYAWSAKLPLSILTNFEEFAVYDCRYRPAKEDKASSHRVIYVKQEEYASRWEEIANVFTRDAILKGSFDKYAQDVRGKRGTQEVDDEFLSDIEVWREVLARNLALRNKKLAAAELNFAVGRTIDRLLFLRVCEDRGIEDYGQIKALLKGENKYKRLLDLFKRADERYNSGLFHFRAEKGRHEQPDVITPALELDDKVLKGIIETLYYPEAPYEFSVFPADILGQVYEQFLGKVIVPKGKTVDVEFKPEVKKAGGVYYTPTYIVDYIVKQTVGKLLEGKTPKEVETLRVLDPACGSGSFLIGAYQYLLDWHLGQYTTPLDPPIEQGEPRADCGGVGTPGSAKKENSPLLSPHKVEGERTFPPLRGGNRKGESLHPLCQNSRGEWRLTLAERKRILLANIYGVDIDAQAVEVTKLSLLLKVLEGESEATVQGELKLRHHALPDLSDNIKCGNSLIGTDILEKRENTPPLVPPRSGGRPDNEIARINPFDWKGEFPEVFRAGGFDAVIGNPPYVRQEVLGHQFKDYAKAKFEVYNSIADLYTYFVEQSHRLLRVGGLYGMICSNKWIRANYGAPLRGFVAKNTTIRELVDFDGLCVFKTAITYPIIILTEARAANTQRFVYAAIKRLDFRSLKEEVAAVSQTLDIRAISGDNWALAGGGELNIIEKMKARGVPLGEYVSNQIYRGILTGLNEAFVIDSETRKTLVKADKKSAGLIKPFAMGKDVKRYCPLTHQYLILIPKGFTTKGLLEKTRDSNPLFSSREAWTWIKRKYPAIAKHLEPFKAKAERRQDQGDYWWELRACDYYGEFEKAKIAFPSIQNRAHFTLDTSAVFSNDKTSILGTDDRYLLGLLNSRMLDFFFQQIASTKQGGFFEYKPMYITQLPIRTIDLSDKADKARHDKLVKLVERMLELNRTLAEAKAPDDRTKLERQIAATDGQIDAVVYELYGLTEEEIGIVEGKS